MPSRSKHDRKPAPALCPKCGTARLHRSRATSRTEELRKKYSPKRPFRCQECGWRGWIEEAHLRYPLHVPGSTKAKVASKDVPVPDFDLNGRTPEQVYERRPPQPERQVGAVDAASSVTVPSTTAEGHTSRAARERDGGRAGTRPSTASKLAENAVAKTVAPSGGTHGAETAESGDVEGEDARYISSITHERPKPFTSKVADNFHRHAHHKASACPACGEYMLYRSHARSLAERLRKRLTSKRPYRCHACAWRGWIQRGF